MGWRSDLSVAAVLLVAGGCARYQAMPLSSEAVNTKLVAPDAHALTIAAEQLQHPILRPMHLKAGAPLSPDEVAVVAVIANPTLRAERDQRGIAAAQLLQAGLLPNPTVTAGLDFPYQSSPPDNFTAYNVGIDWEVTSLIAHDQRRRAAAAQAQSVDLDLAWKEWQTAQEARTAAYAVLALRASLDVARQTEKRLDENLDVVRRAVDRHDKTLVDLAAAQSSAEDAHTAVIEQEKELSHQQLVLNRAVGYPPEEQVPLRDEMRLPALLEPPTGASLLANLEDRRLDLLALKRGYDSQDATLRAAILAQFPRISLGPTIARDTSNVKSIGLGMTIDLPLFDRNQAVIATEKATRQKLFDEYVDRVAAARSEIATALSDIRSLNASIAAGESALSARRQLADVYRASFTRGDVDVLNLYGVETSLWQKQLEVIKLKQQLVESWIALQLAAGQYLPMPATATAPTSRPASEERGT